MDINDRDLPDWIESRIDEQDFSKELTQRRVAEQFVHGERPFYNKTKMHAEVGNRVSPDTVYSRMEELSEREVLDSETLNNGDIFWIDQNDSDWPIPPDVEVKPVEPADKEITLSEWRQQFHIQTAAVSVTVAIIGTAITLVGTFQTGGLYSLPIRASAIIALGLTLGIISYFGLLFAGITWIFEIEELPDILTAE
jgi:hypothetical protein